jgi:Tol biopolymer transport system component/DNA-binding winged helix-turn-helix (wHTH) protein
MAAQPESPARHAFGPFEVDASAGELRKNGIRLRLSGQPLQILVTLLAHSGDVVTREQLRQEIWSETTFVDFEHGLNAAMNKLRRALGDSAEHPKYIETVPGRGYRFIGALERGRLRPAFQDVHPVPETPRERTFRTWWWAAATALCVAASFVLAWRIHGAESELSPWRLNRLTADSGLSDFPALSPDGKLLAYASNRSNPDGGLDLYIQQVNGGQPIRLTFDAAGNTTPDFSPDGNRIVFHSNRNGGGIYEIPAFGGESRLLASEGWNPKYSPDGSEVAYWVGAQSVSVTVPGSGAVWIVPVAGGRPQRVGANFTAARFPIWSPDGKHLLLIGYTAAKAFDSSSIDWWLVQADGAKQVRTGAYEALARAGLKPRDPATNGGSMTSSPGIPKPGCWSAAGNSVIVSVATGDTESLWELGVSRLTGKVNGAPKRLTAGAGNDLHPACSPDGRLAFTNIDIRKDLWSLPFNANIGEPRGPLERITQGPARRENPSLSKDGRYAVFASDQFGQSSVWMRDLTTGRELTVASSSFAHRFPAINDSGSRIAFSVYEKGKRVVYMSTPGGTSEKLCEECLEPTDWSRDSNSLLVFGGNPYQINRLDLASHEQTPLLKHASYSLLYGRFSPDNEWVSFTARIRPNRARLMIAPVSGSRLIPESSWIAIADASADDSSDWSSDGKILYFTSRRDGYTCVWGQKVDLVSRKLLGTPFAALHLHGRLTYGARGWAMADGKIGLALVESTGNIWMMSRSGDR